MYLYKHPVHYISFSVGAILDDRDVGAMAIPSWQSCWQVWPRPPQAIS